MKIGAVSKGVSINLFLFTFSIWAVEIMVMAEFCGKVEVLIREMQQRAKKQTANKS